MYQSLYRKYRPQTFNEIYGQDAISQTLTNAIKLDRVAHAYLFSGPRGTGKTSTAKLLAKALNCTNLVDGKICDTCDDCSLAKTNNHPDVIEIDAASNNGVNEVRELIEKVKYAPIKGRKKVYIIDEVHMMSQGAFNALLKTLEEPPEHVVFILATTELHKVLPTIKSRCQKFNFKKLSENDIVACLKNILDQEKASYDKDALYKIASLCDGGARDALSILEQVMLYSNNDITLKNVEDALDLVQDENINKLFNLLSSKDLNTTLSYIENLANNSVDFQYVMQEIIKKAMDSLLLNTINKAYLLNLIEVFDECLEKLKYDTSKKIYIELACIKTINYLINKDIFINEKTSDNDVNNNIIVNDSEPNLANSLNSLNTVDDIKVENDIKVNKAIIEDNTIEVLQNNDMEEDTIENEDGLIVYDNEDNCYVDEIDSDDINIEIASEDKIISLEEDNNELVIDENTNIIDRDQISLIDLEEDSSNEISLFNEDIIIDNPKYKEIEYLESDYLNILVQAKRDLLDNARKEWDRINSFLLNLNTKQAAGLLIESVPVAACDKAIIVVCKENSTVELINSGEYIDKIRYFINDLLNEELYVLALNKDNWLKLRDRYIQLKEMNDLPKPLAVLERYQDIINGIKNDDDSEYEQVKWVKNMFDNVIIKDEVDENEY